MLDVARLRVFREVAARGSFTPAANALHYTQPAVSHHIGKLEDELGVQLLNRSRRGLSLTPAGEKVLEQAGEVLERLDRAERELADLATASDTTVRVAAFPSAATTLIPSLTAIAAGRHPEISLEVRQADPPESVPALLAGRHDLVLAYDYPVLGEEPEAELDYEVLFEDHVLVALSQDHSLAGGASVDLADLAGESWIAPNPCMCRDALEGVCRESGFEPDVVFQTNDYLAMQGLVAAGVGVALIPRLAAGAAVRDGVVLLAMERPELVRTTSVLTRRNGHRHNGGEPLRNILREVAPTVGPPGFPLEVREPVAG